MAHPIKQSGHRPIRSFTLREGRLTPGQKKALQELWPVYGIDTGIGTQKQAPAFADIFANDHPVILEIGFGNGESLAQTAAQLPAVNFLGIEVHRPGIGHLLLALDRMQLTNVRVINHDAMEVLSGWIPENSLTAIWLFFPDPWPKKKHHKRRIVNSGFLDQIARCLKPQGILHMATDWQDYAVHMRTALKKDSRFSEELSPTNPYRDLIPHRPRTKFERRGLKKGHSITDLFYRFVPGRQA